MNALREYFYLPLEERGYVPNGSVYEKQIRKENGAFIYFDYHIFNVTMQKERFFPTIWIKGYSDVEKEIDYNKILLENFNEFFDIFERILMLEIQGNFNISFDTLNHDFHCKEFSSEIVSCNCDKDNLLIGLIYHTNGIFGNFLLSRDFNLFLLGTKKKHKHYTLDRLELLSKENLNKLFNFKVL